MDRMQDPRVKPVPITVVVEGKRVRVPTREEVELKAYDLLAAAPARRRPPVDVEALAFHVGIQSIRQSPAISKDAILMNGPDGILAILLKKGQSPRRHRFSIAHEIEHQVIHPHVVAHGDLVPVAHRGNPSGIAALERVVNHFAACLLMPRLLVGEAVREGRSFEQLYRMFDVSIPAMAARVRELRLDVELPRGER